MAVANGMTAIALDAAVELAPGVSRGSIDVLDKGRLLARIDLPQTLGTRVSIPLAGVPVVDGHATFELRTRVVADGPCLLDRFTPAVRLVDLKTVYSGVDAPPTVVAEFLPPVLQKVSVYVPASPKASETEAALQLVADLVSQYRPQPVLVETHSFQPGQIVADHPSAPLERQIAVTDEPQPFVELRSDGPAPLLRLAGHGEALTDQVRLLTSDLARLAVTPRAAAGDLAARSQIAPTRATLQDLGEVNLSVTAPLHATVDIGLDQTRFGRPVRNVTLDLRGSYTPPPASSSGRLVVLIGNRELDSWPATGDGHFSRSIHIPNDLLGRFTTVSVRFDQAGPSAGCGLDNPITLEIDPASEVHTESTDEPRPGGFGALPQGLLPRVDVGLADGGFDDTRRAVSLISGLQRLSDAPLIPQVVDFDAAVVSDLPAILIAANGGIPRSIPLPLTEVEVSTLKVLTNEGATDMQVLPGVSFGSLQAAWTGHRMILAATSTKAPDLVDDILRQLDADPALWERLTGDVLFEPRGRPMQMLSLNDRSPTEIPEENASPLVRNIAIAGVALAVATCLAVGFVLVRNRRSPGRTRR
ncbi:MAG: hypothetical protein LLG14_18550 [Nocardiaceae bacterium]|nr:hypothetical protein [Nocardiaceae bacterium]